MADLPPLPPGFALDAAASDHPPLPPGFTLDGQAQEQQPGLMDQGLDFGKQMLQSGGRMLSSAALSVPALATDALAAGANLARGKIDFSNAQLAHPTTWLGQNKPDALPTNAMQNVDQRLEPALGKRPDLFTPQGIAEAVGSGLATPAGLTGQAARVEQAAAPLTRAQQLATLARENVRLDNSQALGGKLALTLKNAANDGAFGSAQAFKDTQAGDFTAAALRQMGITDAREATPAVMQAGKRALKDVYNRVADRNGVQLDDDLATAFDRIQADARSSLTPEHASVINRKVEDILTMMEAGGSRLTGTAYQKIQSSLGQIAKDGGKAPFVTELRQALTGAMARQAPAGDAALLAINNQRYGAMKAVEKAVDANNQISPSALYNAMDTVKGASQSVYGQGANSRLMDLAQAGKAVIGTNTANSGTPQRLAGLAAVSGAGGAITALATGHFETAGALAAAAAVAGVSQQAAKALIYTEAGRRWLQRAAQAQLAAQAAGRGGVTLGQAGAIGAAEQAPE